MGYFRHPLELRALFGAVHETSWNATRRHRAPFNSITLEEREGRAFSQSFEIGSGNFTGVEDRFVEDGSIRAPYTWFE